jgi:glutaredoxin
VQVRNLLKLYQLPSALTLMENTPKKGEWKRMLNTAVKGYWEKSLKEEASTKTTLKHLNLDACSMTASHPVWSLSKMDKINVSKAMVHAKLLVGRYPLMGGSTRTRGSPTSCPLCKSDPETLEHFLLKCSSSHHVRSKYTDEIEREVSKEISPDIEEKDDALVKAILDPSWYSSGATTVDRYNRSRELCFRLHHFRSIKTAGVSRYALVKRKGFVGGGRRKTF